MSIHKLDHVKSNCCNEIVHFQTTNLGYSINVWCSKCKKYLFHGRIETLITFWFGNMDATIKNKGYLPKWIKDLEKYLSDVFKEILNGKYGKIHKQIKKNMSKKALKRIQKTYFNGVNEIKNKDDN